jgi:predicted enzyme related to lactoylglutathione lyase
MKNRVTGIGGIFFKSGDPDKLKKWYGQHLGLPIDEYGASFRWIDPQHPDAKEHALTGWSPMKDNTVYFHPSEKPFMFNYRVENLVELLEVLKTEGVQVVGTVEEFPYGKFGWIMDPEGNKIELWEPKDEGFETT